MAGIDRQSAKMDTGGQSSQGPHAMSRFQNPLTAVQLQDLLYSLTRAILTSRPLNIYSFAAYFLENELTKRTFLELQSGGSIDMTNVSPHQHTTMFRGKNYRDLNNVVSRTSGFALSKADEEIREEEGYSKASAVSSLISDASDMSMGDDLDPLAKSSHSRKLKTTISLQSGRSVVSSLQSSDSGEGSRPRSAQGTTRPSSVISHVESTATQLKSGTSSVHSTAYKVKSGSKEVVRGLSSAALSAEHCILKPDVRVAASQVQIAAAELLRASSAAQSDSNQISAAASKLQNAATELQDVTSKVQPEASFLQAAATNVLGAANEVRSQAIEQPTNTYKLQDSARRASQATNQVLSLTQPGFHNLLQGLAANLHYSTAQMNYTVTQPAINVSQLHNAALAIASTAQQLKATTNQISPGTIESYSHYLLQNITEQVLASVALIQSQLYVGEPDVAKLQNASRKVIQAASELQALAAQIQIAYTQAYVEVVASDAISEVVTQIASMQSALTQLHQAAYHPIPDIANIQTAATDIGDSALALHSISDRLMQGGPQLQIVASQIGNSASAVAILSSQCQANILAIQQAVAELQNAAAQIQIVGGNLNGQPDTEANLQALTAQVEASVPQFDTMAGASPMQVATSQLQYAASHLLAKASQAHPNASELQFGAAQIETAASQLQAMASQDRSGAAQLQSVALGVQNEAYNLRKKAFSAVTNPDELKSAATQVQTAASQLQAVAMQVQPGASQVQVAANQIQLAALQLQRVASQQHPNVYHLQVAASQVENAAYQLQTIALQVQPGASELGNAASQVQSAAAQLRTSAGRPDSNPRLLQTAAYRVENAASLLQAAAFKAQPTTPVSMSIAEVLPATYEESQKSNEQAQPQIKIDEVSKVEQPSERVISAQSISSQAKSRLSARPADYRTSSTSRPRSIASVKPEDSASQALSAASVKTNDFGSQAQSVASVKPEDSASQARSVGSVKTNDFGSQALSVASVKPEDSASQARSVGSQAKSATTPQKTFADAMSGPGSEIMDEDAKSAHAESQFGDAGSQTDEEADREQEPSVEKSVTSRAPSSVCGRPENSASRAPSSICGRPENSASRAPSSVCGRSDKSVSRAPSSVCGRPENSASRAPSSVCGRPENSASQAQSHVSARPENVASQAQSTVSVKPEDSVSQAQSVTSQAPVAENEEETRSAHSQEEQAPEVVESQINQEEALDNEQGPTGHQSETSALRQLYLLQQSSELSAPQAEVEASAPDLAVSDVESQQHNDPMADGQADAESNQQQDSMAEGQADAESNQQQEDENPQQQPEDEGGIEAQEDTEANSGGNVSAPEEREGSVLSQQADTLEVA